MRLTVYVLYTDYGTEEGCGHPEKVTTSAAEAVEWINRYNRHAYSEFILNIEERISTNFVCDVCLSRVWATKEK